VTWSSTEAELIALAWRRNFSGLMEEKFLDGSEANGGAYYHKARRLEYDNSDGKQREVNEQEDQAYCNQILLHQGSHRKQRERARLNS
jgi:hypothetical protein